MIKYPLTQLRVGGCFLAVHSPGLHPVTEQTQRAHLYHATKQVGYIICEVVRPCMDGREKGYICFKNA